MLQLGLFVIWMMFLLMLQRRGGDPFQATAPEDGPSRTTLLVLHLMGAAVAGVLLGLSVS